MAIDPGSARQFLTELLHAAIKAADPAEAIARNLPARPKGRTVVIGAGKASAQMAHSFEVAWGEPVSGLVVTRYGHAAQTRHVEVVEASHPVPDQAGLDAAQRIIDLVRDLGADDLVVALISGGGSALLPAPFPGLTLADEQEVGRQLLASGMPIDKMNSVRNELSAIKGGRLAALAYPARVCTFVVSDVTGDDPALVASGPTIPMAGSREEVRQLIALHGLSLPANVAELLNGDCNPSPAIDDPRFAGNEVHVVASAGISLAAAKRLALRQGVSAHVLSDAIEGEARDAGRVLAGIAREVAARNQPFEAPVVLLSGGETTVTLRGRGKGGRNSEFLLAFALAIDGLETISVLAADTDGIDGSEDNAGAFADGRSVARMGKAGVDPSAALAGNDAWTAFNSVDDLIVTGPTGTNVNDFRAILIV